MATWSDAAYTGNSVSSRCVGTVKHMAPSVCLYSHANRNLLQEIVFQHME